MAGMDTGGRQPLSAPPPQASVNKIELRKGKAEDVAHLPGLQGLKIDLHDDAKSVPDQLREALQSHHVRVIDMFREWDKDASGAVSKKEFREAMAHLQLDVPPREVDGLFETWDKDGSGKLELAEIERLLRPPAKERTEL